MLQKLYTSRGETLTGTPWTVYPRPQMKRDSYLNLNGEWEFSTNYGEPEGVKTIRVPFCPESLLSGIGHHFPEGAGLTYRKYVKLPEGFNRGRVLLHIGAADQNALVFVNKKKLAEHKGGYESFCVDITDVLQEETERLSELVENVLTYISEHIHEALTLESIAQQFYISKYHLSHAFSREVGVSVYRYIMMRRLLMARQLLAAGEPAGQVCRNCGFSDYTSFYRAFKSEYGITPRDFVSGNETS